MFDLITLLACTVTGIATAGVMFALTRSGQADPAPDPQNLGETRSDDVVFLFRDRVLVDATESARSQLPTTPHETDDLGRFIIAFSHRFEGVARRMSSAMADGGFDIAEVPDDPDSLRLVAEPVADCLRVRLHDPLRGTRSEALTHYSLAALRAELFTLRSIAERSPIPTWKRRDDGAIIWANSSYMSLARDVAGEEAVAGWPPPDVFLDVEVPSMEAGATTARISVRTGTDDAWFEVIVLPGEIDALFFALPIDKLVRAENALTEFVQTLTKTFAHLPIGLAIFDQKRRLALFNPALVDLTGLPPDQLSSRPTLHSFLDALRDRQSIPEPKDYKSWRMQIAQLEAGAADGTFEETWHLPSGQTYRVSGRPHPDGAVAYLFEDVSSEVSKTRSFRSEIELSQSVLDSLDVAIAVFSPAGYLTLTNRAYDLLWGTRKEGLLTDTNIKTAIQEWQEQLADDCDLTPVAGQVLQRENRRESSYPVDFRDGGDMVCVVRPISGGATLVTFAPETSVGQMVQAIPLTADATLS